MYTVPFLSPLFRSLDGSSSLAADLTVSLSQSLLSFLRKPRLKIYPLKAPSSFHSSTALSVPGRTTDAPPFLPSFAPSFVLRRAQTNFVVDRLSFLLSPTEAGGALEFHIGCVKSPMGRCATSGGPAPLSSSVRRRAHGILSGEPAWPWPMVTWIFSRVGASFGELCRFRVS